MDAFDIDQTVGVHGYVAVCGCNERMTIEVYRLEAGRWNVDLVGAAADHDGLGRPYVSRTRIKGGVTYGVAASAAQALLKALS